MKRLLSLVLLLAVVGIAAAEMPVMRAQPRFQPLNSALFGYGLQGWQGQLGPLMWDLVGRIYRPVGSKFELQKSDVPVPPVRVCDMFCNLKPVQGIGQ